MISRTATRTKIAPVRQGRSNPDRRKTSAIDHAVRVVHTVRCLAGAASLIDDIRADLRAEGIPSAIRRHDTATLFDWLISALSYQGISDQVATDYMERHGRLRWADIDAKVAASPTCPKLKSYWHFHGCRYDKISRTCSEQHRYLSPAVPPVAQWSAQPDGLLVILVRARRPMVIWSGGSTGGSKVPITRPAPIALPNCMRL